MRAKNLLKCCRLGLLLILAASTSVSAQKKSSGWLNGAWEGVGYQNDDKSTWEIKLTARGRQYSIDYSSLSCGGRWQLISMNASRARFREVLERGQDKCADRGNVLIRRLSRKQILFLYSYKGDRDITASAVLYRKPQS
jgi:hypothetical protein